MKIFTQSLILLTHNEPSSASFLTSCHCIFHSSVIPEFLSDHKDVSYYERLLVSASTDVYHPKWRWYFLFAQSHTMQFSPSLLIPNFSDADDQVRFNESILLPLLLNMREDEVLPTSHSSTKSPTVPRVKL